MGRLFLAGVVALALFAGTAQEARAAAPCGLPERGDGMAWVDFADGSVPFWYRFARPGIIAAASNFIYPPKLRSAGAKTVYFDLYMNSRVGTPAKPTTERRPSTGRTGSSTEPSPPPTALVRGWR